MRSRTLVGIEDTRLSDHRRLPGQVQHCQSSRWHCHRGDGDCAYLPLGTSTLARERVDWASVPELKSVIIISSSSPASLPTNPLPSHLILIPSTNQQTHHVFFPHRSSLHPHLQVPSPKLNGRRCGPRTGCHHVPRGCHERPHCSELGSPTGYERSLTFLSHKT